MKEGYFKGGSADIFGKSLDIPWDKLIQLLNHLK